MVKLPKFTYSQIAYILLMSLNQVKNLVRSKELNPKDTEDLFRYVARNGHFIRDRAEELNKVKYRIDHLLASKKEKDWYSSLLKDWKVNNN